MALLLGGVIALAAGVGTLYALATSAVLLVQRHSRRSRQRAALAEMTAAFDRWFGPAHRLTGRHRKPRHRAA